MLKSTKYKHKIVNNYYTISKFYLYT